MKEINYIITKIKSKFSKNSKETVAQYFRDAGMKIGKQSNICCNIMTMEPWLIEIGDNVTISGDVIFVTHDNSISKIDSRFPNIFGFIRIGDNCFIGQRSTILYGVELANNIIVASGSVVTKSFTQEHIIIGGNPAHIISTWELFFDKNKKYGMGRKHLKEKILSCPEIFIQKKK